jgi:uncharacterized protein (TIGR00299 family) protein
VQRTWLHVRELIGHGSLEPPVRDLALAVFERLAGAEATVHGTSPDEVHFHEVGALDAIADVVGVCAGVAYFDASSVTVSPIAVGSGTIEAAHGTLPVPPPAVAELLRGVPTYAGPVAMEMCTPTGAALLTTLATAYGPQPAMAVDTVGVGAGGRDPEGYANVLRIFRGFEAPFARTSTTDSGPLLLECNVDDLDPRVWPAVLAALLEAGASDAWLTPILMKKGRPAHTLSALVEAERAAGVRSEIFRQTTTIGLREQPLTKYALERELVQIDVEGEQIAVKLARHEGIVVNAQPEWDDVARAAARLGRPVNDVLAQATAASRAYLANDSLGNA